MTITPNIDTKALRELRDDACKLDGHSLMEVLHAQQKYERAIINAAPALLDLAERAQDLEGCHRLNETCPPHLCCADHPPIRHWQSTDPEELSCPVCAEANAKENVEAERVALKAEVERLRSDAEKGDYIPTSMYLQRCEELRTAQREAESVSHWIRLNDMATAKLSASEREAERLREALTTIDEAFAEGGFFDDGFARSTIRAALRGEEAPRE